MGYVVLRAAKIKGRASLCRALQHDTRDRQPPNADPERADDNLLDSTTAAALAKYDQLKPAKIRKNAVHALEYVVSLSPEDFARLGREKTKAYLADAEEWLCRRSGGRSNLLLAGQHWDEETPHLHLVAIPLVDGKLNARALIGGDRRRLEEWQSDFASEVGAKYGLERGISKTGAEHKSPGAYARELALREAEVTRREAEVERKETAVARREAAAAKHESSLVAWKDELTAWAEATSAEAEARVDEMRQWVETNAPARVAGFDAARRRARGAERG